MFSDILLKYQKNIKKKQYFIKLQKKNLNTQFLCVLRFINPLKFYKIKIIL